MSVALYFALIQDYLLGTFCTSLQLAHYQIPRSDLRTMSNLLLLRVFELISLKYNYDFLLHID